MPLHPQAQAMLNAVGSALDLDFERFTAVQLRATFAIPAVASEGPSAIQIENRTIPGAAGPMRARIYRPPVQAPFRSRFIFMAVDL